MTTIQLHLKETPAVPLEAENLTPDIFAELSHDEICATSVQLGKRVCRLDQFFDVEGERSDQIEIHGDVGQLKWVGRSMSRGRLTIHGNIGMHLGARMKGGEIDVHGDASDWVGAEMIAGTIRVRGNAGGQVGAAYRGGLAGMRGGTVLIDGSVGLEIGMRMKKGTIVVGGIVKDFGGLQMKGGNIIMLSGAEIRTGAWMMRGTIISLKPLKLLPTFSYACAYNPAFLTVLARQLELHGVSLPTDSQQGSYQLYSGDSSVPGKGEILVWQPRDATDPTK